MGFAILLTYAGGQDAPRLAFNVWKVTIVINDNMTCFTGGLRTNDTFRGHDLASERCLILKGINLDLTVIVVRSILEEILF